MDVRKGKKGGGNSLPLEYIRERRMKSGTNEARVDCAGEWGPLSRDEFNRKFCTGFPVSISFPRARASTSPPSLPTPASIVAPSKSESPIFSRFFRELENERFAFEFISTLLFVDGNRSLSAYFWSRFFSLFFFFFLSFFLFLNTFCSAWKNHEEGFQFLIAL